MEFSQRLFVRLREALARNRNAQTMTEYVLVIFAIAILVYGAYTVLGSDVGSLANGTDSILSAA